MRLQVKDFRLVTADYKVSVSSSSVTTFGPIERKVCLDRVDGRLYVSLHNGTMTALAPTWLQGRRWNRTRRKKG